MDDIEAERLRVADAGALFGARPFLPPVGTEGNPLAVGRPGRAEVAVHGRRGRALAVPGQVLGLLGLEVQDPYVGRACAALGRDVGELGPVGRQHARVFQRRVGGQALQAGAVGMHAPDVRLPLPRPGLLRREDDPPAVRREARVVVEVRGVGQQPVLARPVGIGDVEFELRRADAVHQHHALLRRRRRSGRREGQGANPGRQRQLGCFGHVLNSKLLMRELHGASPAHHVSSAPRSRVRLPR